MYEYIKCKLHSRNVCYHLLWLLLCFHLISKNIKIKLQKARVVPVVLYGCETQYLTLMEKHWIRLFRI